MKGRKKQGKKLTVDGAQERRAQDVRPGVVGLSAHGAGDTVGQLPHELLQVHVDGGVAKGEVQLADLVAGDDVLLDGGVVAGAEVLGEGLDDVGGQVAQRRARVEEDGERLV